MGCCRRNVLYSSSDFRVLGGGGYLQRGIVGRVLTISGSSRTETWRTRVLYLCSESDQSVNIAHSNFEISHGTMEIV